MRNNIESALKNAKKVDIPESIFVKVDNALRDLEHKEEREYRKPRSKKLPVIAAAAAVICLMLSGMFLLPQSESSNIFSLKAYAMEQMDDGSIELREVDLLGETYYWSFYNDGNMFYVNANLKCEGENIRSVAFHADDGFFAKQYLTIENGKIVREEGVPAMYRKAPGDDEHTLVMYGHDFDMIGNDFTLDSDSMSDDFLLFVGVEVSDWQEYPSQITIRAAATFNDGNTQEEILSLDLTQGELFGTFQLPPEEIARMEADSIRHQELLRSIPLEQCEVIPGSVIALTYGDTFEYQTDDLGTGTGFFQILEEAMASAVEQGLFDENGIMWIYSNLHDLWDEYDGGDRSIAVIEQNGDDTFTGMVYKIPGQLILEKMK
ncbi:MAG: hypothetical protein FWF85_01415 [Clostridiales bacterium]|nr:hypothetical protein [Clostridiales bacterium]